MILSESLTVVENLVERQVEQDVNDVLLTRPPSRRGRGDERIAGLRPQATQALPLTKSE